MGKTLMDISPSASEGGKTVQQMNRYEETWNALIVYYDLTDKEELTLTDLEDGILRHWYSETKKPERKDIISSLIDFAGKKRHHKTHGTFGKRGKRYGFNI
jgi:hypothetical protein